MILRQSARQDLLRRGWVAMLVLSLAATANCLCTFASVVTAWSAGGGKVKHEPCVMSVKYLINNRIVLVILTHWYGMCIAWCCHIITAST